MISRKSTKYELFSSIMVLILCCAMLVGTTFSWFSDSILNADNRIQSGNFEVDLLMYKQEDGAYASIKDSTTGAIFSDKVLWEPNKTEIVYLAVENKGNLALKYNVLLDVQDEGLAGALQYAILDGATAEITSFGSWDDVVEEYGRYQLPKEGDDVKVVCVLEGSLDLTENSAENSVENKIHYFALAVHMNHLADISYQNKSAVIGVKIQATQIEAETDSLAVTYADKITDPPISSEDVSGSVSTGENDTTVDDPVSDQESDTTVDDTVSDEESDTTEDGTVSDEESDAAEDDTVSDEESDTTVDDTVSDEESDTTEDDTVFDEESDTTEDDTVSDQESDTTVDDTVSDEESDTTEDDTVSDEESDTTEDDTVSDEESDTTVDDTVSN